MTCRTLEDYYHINANTFDRQYKDVLSGFRTWAELDHADELVGLSPPDKAHLGELVHCAGDVLG